MKTCYIFAAAKGEPKIFAPKSDDLVIAADAGFLKLGKYGVSPHLVLGDFDSMNEIPAVGEIIKHPVKKDDTDTLLAVKTGFDRGYTRFVIYGGTGGRLDHTLANLQTLSFIAARDGMGFLCGDDFTATALRDSTIYFSEKATGNISVFSATSECKVSIKGLLYNLENKTLTHSFPLGVSNEFIGEKSEISISGGTAFILWSENLEFLL